MAPRTISSREDATQQRSDTGVVRPARPVTLLAGIAGLLAAGAALVGLFWPVDAGITQVESVRGGTVDLYGEGLYRDDSAFHAAGNRGSDVVTLALGVPLLVVATIGYRRGSLRAALLLSGAFTWFLYLYASMALGTMYNELFLVYTAVFSASLFGLLLVIGTLDADTVARRLATVPRVAIARLMLAGGVVTLVVWLLPLVTSLVSGDPPDRLDHYTVTVTDVLDLGLITPATLLTAHLLHRRDPRGWLLAVPLLVLLVALLPMISAQTAFQLEAGVDFEPGEIVGPVSGFVVLAGLALWLLARTLRIVPSPTRAENE